MTERAIVAAIGKDQYLRVSSESVQVCEILRLSRAHDWQEQHEYNSQRLQSRNSVKLARNHDFSFFCEMRTPSLGTPLRALLGLPGAEQEFCFGLVSCVITWCTCVVIRA